MITKVSDYLGLAYRARKLKTGSDVSLTEIQKQTADLVLISSTASEGTKKKFTDKATYYKVPHYIIDESIINNAIPKKNIKVLVIIDKGFSESIVNILKIN